MNCNESYVFEIAHKKVPSYKKKVDPAIEKLLGAKKRSDNSQMSKSSN